MSPTVFIALLRAVNVGGRSVAMADLRALLGELEFGNPRTLLQSGNAIFAARTRTASAALEKRLETESEQRFGMPIAFMLRSAAEWDGIIAANPFAEVARNDPARMVYVALKAAPTAGAIKALREGYKGPETFQVAGRDAYFVYPDGQGKSKMTNALIERKLGVAATARNWNTVRKLAALAAQ